MTEKVLDLGKIMEEYLDLWFDRRGDEVESRVGVGGHLGAVDFVEFVKEIENANDNGY